MHRSHPRYDDRVTSSEIMQMLHDSGFSHGELAEHSGVARETILRWQADAQRPSLEDLQRVVTAAGAELDVRLRLPASTLAKLAHDQLNRGPSNALELLLGKQWPACRQALRAAAYAENLSIIVGPVAAALSGAPSRPGDGRVDLLVPAQDREELATWLTRGDAFPDGVEQSPDGSEQRERWQAGSGTLTVRSHAAGFADLTELRNRARKVGLRTGTVTVALVEDLLELGERSPWLEDQDLTGLRAIVATGRYVLRK
jgi:transcriptional regulator with XRE-family HTH domain